MFNLAELLHISTIKLLRLEFQIKMPDFSTLYLLCILILWKYKLCIVLRFRRTVDLGTATEVPHIVL